MVFCACPEKCLMVFKQVIKQAGKIIQELRIEEFMEFSIPKFLNP